MLQLPPSPLSKLIPRFHSREDGLRVYLAGGIEKALEDGAVWRRELTPFLQDELGIVVHDPTIHEGNNITAEERRNFRVWKNDPHCWDKFQSIIHKIIRRDLEIILQDTDFIIAYWDESVLGGGGTHGELTVSRLHGIPVLLVLGMPRSEVSSWILGCAEQVFDSFAALRAQLLQWRDGK